MSYFDEEKIAAIVRKMNYTLPHQTARFMFEEIAAGIDDIPGVADVEEFEEALEAVVLAVGDAESGLVKDVADLEESFEAFDLTGIEEALETLTTTVGNEEAGLVHDVAALDEVIGDEEGGLTAEVMALQETVGDEEAGLVLAVGTLVGEMATAQNDIGDLEGTLTDWGTQELAVSGVTASETYDDEELQAVVDKLDALITALQTIGIIIDVQI